MFTSSNFLIDGMKKLAYRVYPIEYPVFLDRQETIHCPSQVVLVLKRSQSGCDDFCRMGSSRNLNRSTRTSQTETYIQILITKLYIVELQKETGDLFTYHYPEMY